MRKLKFKVGDKIRVVREGRTGVLYNINHKMEQMIAEKTIAKIVTMETESGELICRIQELIPRGCEYNWHPSSFDLFEEEQDRDNQI